MSALGSVVTAIGGATGDKGSYSLDTLTKNQGIQSALNNLIGSYNSQVSNDSTDLNSYIKNYLAGTNQATQNTAQETGAIDRYYNGDVARQLAGLRAQQSQLGNQSVAQALAYQRGNQNRALVTGGGGDSSYDNRIGIGTAANLNLANNLQNLAQQRSDINQVDQSQLALAGQRNNLADAAGWTFGGSHNFFSNIPAGPIGVAASDDPTNTGSYGVRKYQGVSQSNTNHGTISSSNAPGCAFTNSSSISPGKGGEENYVDELPVAAEDGRVGQQHRRELLQPGDHGLERQH